MVGRTESLDELTRAWSRIADTASVRSTRGRRTVMGRTAVITGAAGTGKSRLVDAVIEALDPGVVLSGTARVHSPAPYDWLAAVLCRHDTAGLRVPPDALSWLAQHPDVPRERYAPDALLRIAVRVVRELVAIGPAVLIVEDLHALDPASLNLIGELASTPDLPMLLVVTSRPPDLAVSPALAARTLTRLGGSPGAIRQHLTSLRRVDIALVLADVFADRPVTDDVIDAVMRRTGGNPYRLTELLATGEYDVGQYAHGFLDDNGGTGRPSQPSIGTVVPGCAPLTARELDVLACLAAGMSNKDVARSLGISIRTVTVHVSNLLRKTRSSSRTDAALWAVRHEVQPAPLPVAG